jgi:hypothetical protein
LPRAVSLNAPRASAMELEGANTRRRCSSDIARPPPPQPQLPPATSDDSEAAAAAAGGGAEAASQGFAILALSVDLRAAARAVEVALPGASVRVCSNRVDAVAAAALCEAAAAAAGRGHLFKRALVLWKLLCARAALLSGERFEHEAAAATLLSVFHALHRLLSSPLQAALLAAALLCATDWRAHELDLRGPAPVVSDARSPRLRARPR